MHCGLDFGTSNSTLCIAPGNERARAVPLENGRATIPSTIFFSFEEDVTLYGRAATAAYIGGQDGRLMRALKSILGSSLAEETTRIKKRMLPFLDILGMFVAELKQRAETEAGALFDTAVVGRPVHFNDDDAEADREAQRQLESAVQAQGFRHVAFQYEPIAAALDYEQQVMREELGLVIDLGGGTSDFSIVRVSPERARATDRTADILSTAGVHVGGTDFDRILSLGRVMPPLGYRTETADGKRPLPSWPYYDLATWHRINRLYTPELLRELRQTEREAAEGWRVAKMISIIQHREGHRLAGTVEEAKIALTDQTVASVMFEGHEVSLEVQVTQPQLAGLLEASIDKIAATIAVALKAAGLRAGQIETLILTGGSTQIPAIMARLRALFPGANFVNTDAFASVGLGLALDARRKFA